MEAAGQPQFRDHDPWRKLPAGYWKSLPFEGDPGADAKRVLYTSNEELAHFACFRDLAFNPTIAKDGDKILPPVSTVKRILEDLQVTPECPLRVYHCVPANAFDSWNQPPQFQSNNNTPKEDKEFVNQRVKQYALKIPKARPPSAQGTPLIEPIESE